MNKKYYLYLSYADDEEYLNPIRNYYKSSNHYPPIMCSKQHTEKLNKCELDIALVRHKQDRLKGKINIVEELE